LPFRSAQTDASHRREHPDTDVVVVKVLAAQCHTATRGPVAAPDPVGESAQTEEREGERRPGQNGGLFTGLQALAPLVA